MCLKNMLIMMSMSRQKNGRKGMRDCTKSKGSSGLGLLLVLGAAAALVIGGAFALHHFKGKKIHTEDISSAEKIAGLRFTHKERNLMLDDLRETAGSYAELGRVDLPNHVPPALQLNPIQPGTQKKGTVRFSSPPGPVGVAQKTENQKIGPSPFSLSEEAAERPSDLEDLAFAPVTTLARLIRSREVTSTERTQMYLARLKKYGPRLECVIPLTEDLALAQAKRADEEIAAGRYRGPLHGIPYGAKDLFATEGIRTTWGSKPEIDQIPDHDATVIERLEQAGAVLVAKLTLGELAWGDVWFGGKTRNPWNYEQGSSGSARGSDSATAARLACFSRRNQSTGNIL